MSPTWQASKRVLVVDDEEPILRFAEHVLRDAGYEVVLASSGAEALNIVDAQAPFDLFVLDLVMPRMRGDELARHLRVRDMDVKVLYFTGYSDRLFAERAVLWQNESFVEKPVTVDGLREAASLMLLGRTNESG
jgi:CheY-like chemotaxis protein